MIRYEENPSEYFRSNKAYCEAVCSSLNVDCSGYCNSYGYEIRADLRRGPLTYKLTFTRHQSTQNGVIVPVDARNYAGLEVEVSGWRLDISVALGKSAWRRLLMHNRLKAGVPAPYYLSINKKIAPAAIAKWMQEVQQFPILSFRLRKGKAMYHIQGEVKHPLGVITSVEEALSGLG